MNSHPEKAEATRTSKEEKEFRQEIAAVNHAFLRRKGIREIVAYCAFCNHRIIMRQPINARVKPRYYCSDGCEVDYGILMQPEHPDHDEVKARQRRMWRGAYGR